MYLFTFYTFQMSALDCCWRWDLRPNRLWFHLRVSSTFWKASEERWGELGGSIRRSVLYTCYVLLDKLKVALKRKGWELTVDGFKVMSSVVSS